MQTTRSISIKTGHNGNESQKNTQLSPDDLPTDEELIAIADNFLKEHGIKRENYGDPIVNKYWRETGMSDFVPDTLTIIYPLLINGKEVLDQGGKPQWSECKRESSIPQSQQPEQSARRTL